MGGLNFPRFGGGELGWQLSPLGCRPFFADKGETLRRRLSNLKRGEEKPEVETLPPRAPQPVKEMLPERKIKNCNSAKICIHDLTSQHIERDGQNCETAKMSIRDLRA